jgi:hypothetical protein
MKKASPREGKAGWLLTRWGDQQRIQLNMMPVPKRWQFVGRWPAWDRCRHPTGPLPNGWIIVGGPH